MNSPEYMKAYQLKHKEKLALYKKQWQALNRKEINQKKRDDYYQNLEVHKERMKVYRETSDYDFQAAQKRYRQENKDRLAQVSKDYRIKNKDKINATNAKRRCSKLSRTPQWLNDAHKKEIVSIYTLAKEQTKQTGIKHHVDHIVPLQGKTISGLHVPWNLQVLPEHENIAKSNRNWPDNW